MDESTATNADPGGDAAANLSPTLQRIQVYSDWLDAILIRTGYISGSLFALAAFFIIYDVLARKWGYLIGISSTRVTDEISGYILVLAGTWGMAIHSERKGMSASTSCCRLWDVSCGPSWTLLRLY